MLGLARSGTAAALALRRSGVEVVACDRSDAVDVGRLVDAGVEVHLGRDDESVLDEGVYVLVKSPGVPGDAPLVRRARELGVPIWSEVELGASMLSQPLVGVTGTNGKTTTTALLGAMFDAAERPVEVAGNIGRPLSSLVGEISDDAWIVCELSSFQLEDIHTLTPHIAVMLNLEPDHIDRHGTFERYRDAKLRIFEHQTARDVAVVPAGFGAIPGDGRRIEFSPRDLLPAEPHIPGEHNRENAAAATATARSAGIPEDAIAKALRTFPGVPHRIEQVATVRGVRFVNDSKATNVAATRRAVASFDAPLHLVVGGLGKHESYDELASALSVRDRAYLIGDAAPEIAEALGRHGVPFEHCGDIQHAFAAAIARANPGEVVLLSPACASFDQFSSYEERGDVFRTFVSELAREAGTA